MTEERQEGESNTVNELEFQQDGNYNEEHIKN